MKNKGEIKMFEKMKELIAEQLNCPAEEIKMESSFKEVPAPEQIRTTGPAFASRFPVGRFRVFSDKTAASQLLDTDRAECRIRAIEQPFDLRLIVLHRFDELPDIDALSGAQGTHGQTERRCGLAFPVAGVDMYIPVALHSYRLI